MLFLFYVFPIIVFHLLTWKKSYLPSLSWRKWKKSVAIWFWILIINLFATFFIFSKKSCYVFQNRKSKSCLQYKKGKIYIFFFLFNDSLTMVTQLTSAFQKSWAVIVKIWLQQNLSGTRHSPNDPKLTYDPWWSEKEKYGKNREICKLLKWQKNILWRMSFIFSCLSQLSEVSALWTCLLLCLTGSIGGFTSHLESKISDEIRSFLHFYSYNSTFTLFKQET